MTLGPALRRGALDKGGAEAVGGVVVVRYGYNPLEAIKNVKKKIAEIAAGLPTKAVIDYRQVIAGRGRGLRRRHNDFDAFVGRRAEPRRTG